MGFGCFWSIYPSPIECLGGLPILHVACGLFACKITRGLFRFAAMDAHSIAFRRQGLQRSNSHGTVQGQGHTAYIKKIDGQLNNKFFLLTEVYANAGVLSLRHYELFLTLGVGCWPCAPNSINALSLAFDGPVYCRCTPCAVSTAFTIFSVSSGIQATSTNTGQLYTATNESRNQEKPLLASRAFVIHHHQPFSQREGGLSWSDPAKLGGIQRGALLEMFMVEVDGTPSMGGVFGKVLIRKCGLRQALLVQGAAGHKPISTPKI